MVFYAYLDPAVISRAYENQPYGYQCLIAMLRGFVQNCCIIDEGGRVRAALAEQLEKLPGNFDRKMLDEILGFLCRHNRFIDAAEEADVCISESEPAGTSGAVRGRTDVCSLANYQFTDFEHLRSSVAQGGETYCHAEQDGEAFLDGNYRKALRHACWIKVCDGSFGKEFKENYRYSCERFLTWLREIHADRGRCTVTFLCVDPSYGSADPNARNELSRMLEAHGAKVEFYSRLPHERFILTDQIAFEIGRGMDFLLPANDRNRDVSIGSKNIRQVTKLVASYGQFLLPTVA